MSPLVISILGALLRHALGIAGAMLVTHHWLTESQADEAQVALITYLLSHAAIYGPVVVAVMWSVWQKVRSRLLTIAASELPPGASDAQIAAKATSPIIKALLLKTL